MMTTWTLILTILYNGAAIHDVPGFYSETDCNVAGRVWETKQKVGATNWVCVPVKWLP